MQITSCFFDPRATSTNFAPSVTVSMLTGFILPKNFISFAPGYPINIWMQTALILTFVSLNSDVKIIGNELRRVERTAKTNHWGACIPWVDRAETNVNDDPSTSLCKGIIALATL